MRKTLQKQPIEPLTAVKPGWGEGGQQGGRHSLKAQGSPKTYFVLTPSPYHIFFNVNLTSHLITFEIWVNVILCFHAQNKLKILPNLFDAVLNNSMNQKRLQEK